MRKFLGEVVQTFSPSHWGEISQRSINKSIGFFSKVLILAFVVMLLLAIPTLLKLPRGISEQLGKFEALQLSGKFNMSSPIKLPKSDPVIVFDTSGAYTELTKERVVITRDKIFYRPLFKTYDLNTEELKDLKNNREQVKTFLAMLAFFLLPSVLFYAYLVVWLKYFLLIVILSLIVFLLLDLTHWRRTWKEIMVIACHVSTLPVLAEVVVGAIDAKFLIPVLSIAGLIQLYLVPAVVLSVLTIGAALCVHYQVKDSQHDV